MVKWACPLQIIGSRRTIPRSTCRCPVSAARYVLLLRPVQMNFLCFVNCCYQSIVGSVMPLQITELVSGRKCEKTLGCAWPECECSQSFAAAASAPATSRCQFFPLCAAAEIFFQTLQEEVT
jgi:hypothetical protein